MQTIIIPIITTASTTGINASPSFLTNDEIKAPIGTAIATSIIRSLGLLNFFS